MVVDVVTENPWSFALLILLVYILCMSIPRRPHNAPPGPIPLPVIGNLPHFLADPRDNWRKLQKKYGDIYSLYMGNSLTVVLHTYDVIKEAFLQHGNVTSDRPDVFVLQKLGHNKGIASASGQGWREHRLFTLKTLKAFGLDKLGFEDKIQEEISVLLAEIDTTSGNPFDITTLLHTSVSNVICSVVFGQRFRRNDPDFINCLQKISANGQLIDATGVLNIFPSLFHLPGDPTNIHKVLSNQDEIHAFIRRQISRHKQTLNPQKPRDFIDAYLLAFKEKQKRNPDTEFSEEQLTRVVSDLFVAGSETTSSTLQWMLLYLIKFPDLQDKLHQELDDVLQPGTHPFMSHRPSLPVLQSVVSETQRFADILPVGAPHAASRGFELSGYYIPEGTILLPFLHGVHFHPSWGDPDVFRPSRFLSRDSTLITQDMLLPFSIGRRSCIGENLAKMELFLFAAAMLNRYKFSLPVGESLPSLRSRIGHTVAPQAFKLCAHRRTREPS